MGTLCEDQYTFMIISGLVLLRMRNVSDKSCKEFQNTHFIFSNFFFKKLCHWWYTVENYSKARQVTNDSMVHVQFMLDT